MNTWPKSWFPRRRLARRLPGALIIGAQKCGTSALFSYLAQHPRLAPSREKELDFFGSDMLYGRGLEWYVSHWSQGPSANSLRFEASPQYLAADKACARIRASLPNVKLIAVLRDPVERAYSSWRMYRQQIAADPDFYTRLHAERYGPGECSIERPRTTAEFEDFWLAVQLEAEGLSRGQWSDCSVLALGLYGPQLRRFFDAFPRQQLLVLDSQDLRTRKVETLNRVLHFLGIPAWDWSGANLADVFVGEKASPMPPHTRAFLQHFFRESNRMLEELLPEPPHFARRSAAAAA